MRFIGMKATRPNMKIIKLGNYLYEKSYSWHNRASQISFHASLVNFKQCTKKLNAIVGLAKTYLVLSESYLPPNLRYS